jgi:hypothetical protein
MFLCQCLFRFFHHLLSFPHLACSFVYYLRICLSRCITPFAFGEFHRSVAVSGLGYHIPQTGLNRLIRISSVSEVVRNKTLDVIWERHIVLSQLDPQTPERSNHLSSNLVCPGNATLSSSPLSLSARSAF